MTCLEFLTKPSPCGTAASAVRTGEGACPTFPARKVVLLESLSASIATTAIRAGGKPGVTVSWRKRSFDYQRVLCYSAK